MADSEHWVGEEMAGFIAQLAGEARTSAYKLGAVAGIPRTSIYHFDENPHLLQWEKAERLRIICGLSETEFRKRLAKFSKIDRWKPNAEEVRYLTEDQRKSRGGLSNKIRGA